MALYSTQLAIINTDTAGAQYPYTVPAAGGPCIVKNVTWGLVAGAKAGLGIEDSSLYYAFDFLDNSGGAETIYEVHPTWVVLNPGQKLELYLYEAEFVTATISGYQFSAP